MIARRIFVVIASIAGLCAARVLSDFFDRVTVYERDDLPANPANRSAVPQGRHLHLLLARGAEESLALVDAGVPIEIVPGLTTASAAPTLAGIPLTHRGIASGFVVVSGHAELFARAGAVNKLKDAFHPRCRHG